MPNEKMNANRPINVHLTGGENMGWALDFDLAVTRASLEALGGHIRLTSLAEADVVHSVWEEPLLELPARALAGKRIVCHICNDLLRNFENPAMLRALDRIGLWIPQTSAALRDVQQLRLDSFMIPYAVDTDVFRERPDAEPIAKLRRDYAIPENCYLLGNFMRDTLGADLSRPKMQKGAELFLEIVRVLFKRGLPVHVLLAGPRRHWLRRRLHEHGIPFTYIGAIQEGDDNRVNILPPEVMNHLYHLINLYVITSRWEGGPRAVLEAAACRTKIVSAPYGIAPDILDAKCLFHHVGEAVDVIASDIEKNVLSGTLSGHLEKIRHNHTSKTNEPKFRDLYANISAIEPYQSAFGEPKTVAVSFLARVHGRVFGRRGLLPVKPAIGLWHEFHKPPYGGGNQFMMALKKALERLGVKVKTNSTSSSVDIHVCNSAWFNVEQLEAISSRRTLRMIHRVDGPVALYRGTDWKEDEKIQALNQRFASATVFQSAWCFRKMVEHGLQFRNPVIVKNSVDEGIFNRNGKTAFLAGQKIRLISSAWSDNPRKGGPFYKQLDRMLDWDRYEYTFVGRVNETFDNIRCLPAQGSAALATLLRQHDIYITASQADPCSNALLEALACGLPALYLDDGGHGELVGWGGLPFKDENEAIVNLGKIADYYEAFQGSIALDNMDTVARRYLDVASRIMEMQ